MMLPSSTPQEYGDLTATTDFLTNGNCDRRTPVFQDMLVESDLLALQIEAISSLNLVVLVLSG